MKEPTKQFMVRLPLPLLKKLDAFAKKQQQSTGVIVSRTAAVRFLLNKSLR